MKLPPDLLALLKRFAPGSLGTLAVVLLVLGLMVPAGHFLLKWWKSRKGAAAGPNVDAGLALPTTPALEPAQLRRAWLRFFRKLTPVYRRSILNFEHFVLLGFAGSGKSRVVDTYSDWRRQTKQFAGSHSPDADLQVYLASGAVLMELPARVLSDLSASGRTALGRLWRPLYQKRSPTVVVAVDAVRLAEMAPELIADRAETIRSKVNLLAEIRGRTLEVRVVLTHLDEVDGFSTFAKFARDEGLSTRIGFVQSEGAQTLGAQFLHWMEATRGQFARALTTSSSGDFRAVVTFLRRAPELAPSVGQFLDALFAKEALSAAPVCGGVYLSSEPGGLPSPLRGAAEVGPGPNPRTQHLVAAIAGATAVSAFFILAYTEQRALWAPAARALEDYASSPYGSEMERRRRDTVCELTYRGQDWIQRHPDFFDGPRTRMRTKMSQALREAVLVPSLKTVAQRGALREGVALLPWRRALYTLAVIHSDKHDGLHLTEPASLDLWSNMTGLGSDVIVDYVKNTDVAWRTPVSFELGEKVVDPRDTAAYWAALARQLQSIVAAGVVGGKELEALHQRVADGLDALDRFEHDDVTRGLVDRLDAASSAGGERRGPGELDLSVAYKGKFSEFLGDPSATAVVAQRDKLRAVLRAVRGSQLEIVDAPDLRRLVDRLSSLYAVGTSTVGAAERRVELDLAGSTFVFELGKWRDLLRDSEAAEQIVRFAREREAERSIFFDRGQADEILPVAWNSTNDGSAMFTGKAVLDRKNTAQAYEKYVREPVKKLSELLDKAKLPEDLKHQLRNHVKEQVKRYALDYRRDLVHFYQSFGLRTPSEESLRVALTQMVRDVSPFADFLAAVHKHSKLTVDDGMLEPMTEIVSEWGSFHNVVEGAGGAPELAKYRAILQQLLGELGDSSAGAVGDAGAPVASGSMDASETLERALTPSGRLVLANLRGEKGAYGAMVHQWLGSIGLPGWQQSPFSAPIDQLHAMGKKDLEHAIARTWDRDMAPELTRLGERFPFDPEGTEEASPRDIAALLHPQTGRFFDLFRRYLEPISEVDGGPFRERRSLRGQLGLPSNMYSMVNAAAALSSRLWDAGGKPVPVAMKVATVPFEHGPDPRSALTLVYMNVGEASLFNFNQKPTVTTVRSDWTKEHNAQIGLQFTDLETKENAFPEPAAIEGSYWPLLHLLKRAHTSPVKQPLNAALHSWEFNLKKGSSDKVRARFVVIGDPWQSFAFAKAFRHPVAHALQD